MDTNIFTIPYSIWWRRDKRLLFRKDNNENV